MAGSGGGVSRVQERQQRERVRQRRDRDELCKGIICEGDEEKKTRLKAQKELYNMLSWHSEKKMNSPFNKALHVIIMRTFLFSESGRTLPRIVQQITTYFSTLFFVPIKITHKI